PALHRLLHRRRVEGPLLLRNEKQSPTSRAAHTRSSHAHGRNHRRPFGTQPRRPSRYRGSLARSSTTRHRRRNVCHIHYRASTALLQIRPLTPRCQAGVKASSAEEGWLRGKEKVAKPP